MADESAVDPVPTGDVEMEEQEQAEEDVPVEEFAMQGEETEVSTRTTFLDYLKSPIINLVVGRGDEQLTLAAHEGLLIKSPYFAQICSDFKPRSARRIELPDDDIEAVGSVLEYLYHGEYFPKRLYPANKESPLEHDPTIVTPDTNGVGLLRHAHVYTLASKFSLPELGSLAHSKIHRTESTATGEIAYARYVYQSTEITDVTLRRPIAAFWATRSHVLRHEADEEFRSLCLEFPQFGFDVLSLVLDQREKKSGASVEIMATQATPASSRKRRRDL